MNEELERTMTFIVNQQAQFAVDIEKLRERQDKFSVDLEKLNGWQEQFSISMNRLEAKQEKTEEVVTRLAYVTNEGFKQTNEKINALVNAHIDLAEAQKKTEETLNAKFQLLADSQKKTEETLNTKFQWLADSQKKTDKKFRELLKRLDRRFNNGDSNSS